MLGAIGRLLPPQRPMMLRIWHEVNLQCANYVRGKAVEILIVGGATYVAFKLLGMPYAALLSLLVGLSVVIPYIGAAVVTIPVAMIGLFAFGWGSHFIWVMVVYGVIQALDGNVLVPVLFSEVNKPSPGGDHRSGSVLRRNLGLVGGILCHSPGDDAQSGFLPHGR